MAFCDKIAFELIKKIRSVPTIFLSKYPVQAHTDGKVAIFRQFAYEDGCFGMY